ncbi:MAG: MaoC family dehydratase N-terminal domain-containing protein [Alicyclobacillus shizuokensis]|nr:MaoC family dehydratase N-terminal domain-containing protein [Alicyclobacillus shizuokensis]
MMGTRFARGETIGPVSMPPVTRIQLVQYADASGDFNPIHTVDQFAQAVGLGGVIAHGMLTMAFVGEMLTQVIGEAGDLLQFSVRFTDMVRPGDVVTCQGRIERVEIRDAWEIAECDVSAAVASDRTVVQGKAVFRVPHAT